MVYISTADLLELFANVYADKDKLTFSEVLLRNDEHNKRFCTHGYNFGQSV
jgi:hypothetical protein